MNAVRTAQGFDRLAPYYDALTRFFGNAILHSQTSLGRHLKEGARVLVIGGGTGEFLETWLRAHDRFTMVFVDLSPAMIARARRRIDKAGIDPDRIELRTGGIESINAHERFDAIGTFYFLDLFSEESLQRLMPRLNQALVPGGQWMVADFDIPDKPRSRKVLSRILIKMLYIFFRMICRIEAHTLPDAQATFKKFGYIRQNHDEWLGGLIVTTVWQKPL